VQTATGRRKEAIARVRLVPGTGAFQLNGRTLDEYFTTRAHRMVVAAPLRLVERDRDLDVIARIEGGGVSGQAGALRSARDRPRALQPDVSSLTSSSTSLACASNSEGTKT
jgi:ribosomal protein S9